MSIKVLAIMNPFTNEPKFVLKDKGDTTKLFTKKDCLSSLSITIRNTEESSRIDRNRR